MRSDGQHRRQRQRRRRRAGRAALRRADERRASADLRNDHGRCARRGDDRIAARRALCERQPLLPRGFDKATAGRISRFRAPLPQTRASWVARIVFAIASSSMPECAARSRSTRSSCINRSVIAGRRICAVTRRQRPSDSRAITRGPQPALRCPSHAPRRSCLSRCGDVTVIPAAAVQRLLRLRSAVVAMEEEYALVGISEHRSRLGCGCSNPRGRAATGSRADRARSSGSTSGRRGACRAAGRFPG